MPRVRIGLRRRERVHDPPQPSVVADDHVGIGIERQEASGERLDALAHVPPHQQPAVGAHVVAERQLRQIAAIERDEQAPQEPAEHDPAGALVRRDAVRVALRVVELVLPSLHVHVGVRHLAEIDLRPRDLEARRCALHGHVAEEERRQALGREAVDRVHRHAVAVGVDQLLVDPVAAALGQLVDAQFAGADHDLTHAAVDLVAVDVDVGEVVVGPDLLDLAERVLQRAPVPQADVVERRAVARGVDRLDARLDRKRALRDPVQAERLLRHLNVVRDVRAFLTSSFGFTMKPLTYQPRIDTTM